MLHKPLINIKLYPSQLIHDNKAKHDFYPSQPGYKDNVTKASKPYHRIQIKTLHAINGLTTLTQNKINVGASMVEDTCLRTPDPRSSRTQHLLLTKQQTWPTKHKKNSTPNSGKT